MQLLISKVKICSTRWTKMKNVELMYQGVIEQKVKYHFFPFFKTFFLEILISLLLIVAPACATTHIEGKDLLYKMDKV